MQAVNEFKILSVIKNKLYENCHTKPPHYWVRCVCTVVVIHNIIVSVLFHIHNFSSSVDRVKMKSILLVCIINLCHLNPLVLNPHKSVFAFPHSMLQHANFAL